MALRSGRLTGRTFLTVTATQDLSSFHLDLVLPTDRVLVDGVPAAFTRPDRHEVRVVPAEPIAAGRRFRVRVDYHGRPGPTAYGGERPWVGNTREVVAMGQPHIAPWWFPANDHPRDKATFDLHVRVPRGREAVANGRLVGRDVGRDWTSWHWRSRQPMAPYLAFFAAGDFRLERGTAGGTPYVLAVSERLTARAAAPRARADAPHPAGAGLARAPAGGLPVRQHRRADHLPPPRLRAGEPDPPDLSVRRRAGAGLAGRPRARAPVVR